MLTLEAVAARGLAPLDLTIEAGACVALSGPSGSGKTVLLRAIADLDPNGGDAVAGELRRSAVPAPRWRRRVGYLSAEPGWWAERVGDHFADAPDSALGDLFESLGLPRGALDWSVRTLSTGERQRLAFARMLRRDPATMLLDEPTAALDEDSVERVEALVRQRLESGASVLIVTHNEQQAERLATRRLRIESGAVVDRTP